MSHFNRVISSVPGISMSYDFLSAPEALLAEIRGDMEAGLARP